MSVFSRIAQISKPYHGTLYGGLLLVVVGTFLDTAVITTLFAALLFAVIGKEGFTAQGLQADDLKMMNIDFAALLERLLGRTGHVELLAALAAVTVVVVFLKSACIARQGFLMHRFANLMAREVRQRLFNHLLRLSPVHFERESTGANLSRITGDVVVLQTALGPQLAEVLHAPLTIAMSLGMMFFINWKLTLIALCLAPVIAVAMAAGGRLIRKLSIRIQERMADLNAALVERLGNVRVIQSFVREPFESEQVARVNQQYYRSTMRSVLLTEILTPGIEFIAYIGMILGIVAGGIAVLHGDMAAQDFVLFLMVAQRAGSQFKGLSRINQVRQQASGAGARIFELLDEEPEIRDAPDAEPLPPVEGRITFENVSFNYGDGEEVLRDIDLQVQPGEIIALVGPSGSGKTTLVNLLPRFYDVTAGRILIDGRDVRAVTLASLREQIGIVPQETILFSGTVEENIRYGKLDASETEVCAAAEAGNALEFIERLPEGFGTLVGERGARLSGGQRQRVAIARALLKNPRILILDEATSALDTESEHLVQQALERLMQDRTTFVIAHRLSTIMHAHRILVLNRGRITETGTHAELLAKGGLYQRLYEMQFRTESRVP
jgi:subfamily B ATP-binding cassette protein MsbA